MKPCPNCRADFDSLTGEVDLDSRHPYLHCPICGERADLPEEGFTFDPVDGELIVWGQPDCATRYGGLQVRVHGKEMHLSDCLYTHVAFFATLERHMVSPVRPEKRHLILDCRLVPDRSTATVVYEVYARGGYRKTVSRACVTVPNPTESGDRKLNQAALLIWPNFKMSPTKPGERSDNIPDCWRRYYVTFVTPSVPQGRGELHRILSLDDKGLVASIWDADGLSAELDAAPDLIELVWEDNVDHQTYYSVLKPEFRTIKPSPVEKVTLGFDFGTSNTAAAIRVIRGASMDSDDLSILEIADLTLQAIAGQTMVETSWLPRPVSPAPSLPSYLYFPNRGSREIHDGFRPVEDYTIPFSQRDLVDRLAEGGFKWKKHVKEGRPLATLRFLYLRLALEMYLAQAIVDYELAPCSIELVATFPLAFDKEHLELHETSFKNVIASLEQYCPFRFIPSLDLSESHAGENGSDPIRDIEELLIVDCGGGTTDICVTEPVSPSDSNDLDPRPGKRRAVFQQDSIEYGGESLILATQKLTRGPMGLFELRQMIRTRNPTALDEAELYVDNKAHLQAQDISWKFRRGLIEICARFIAARITSLHAEGEPPRFGLLMLGNGWRLLKPAGKGQDLAEFVRQRIEKRLGEYRQAGDLARLPKSISVIYSKLAKGAVALGAAKKDYMDVPPGNQQRTYMLLNMTMAIGTIRRLPWIETVPYNLDSKPANLKLDGVQQFGFDDAEICQRPPGRDKVPAAEIDFLRECAPAADKVLQIRRSPFGMYMRLFAEAFSPPEDTQPK
ncbi:MAG TPA: hypothetical protein VMF91_04135 [Bryobacteraceae bacterium]|nr:hypothetical protein [Bryobacteraceae bacterium]